MYPAPDPDKMNMRIIVALIVFLSLILSQIKIGFKIQGFFYKSFPIQNYQGIVQTEALILCIQYFFSDSSSDALIEFL